MSTTIMAACWPLQMPPTPKAVLISLADNANDQGWAWPSMSTISERTCFSERAVQNAIKWLEDVGVVTADRSNGRHTKYQLTPSKYKTPAGDAPPQEMHPRSRCRGTPAGDAGVPPQEVRQPPQEVPSNRQEPSKQQKQEAGAGKEKPKRGKKAKLAEQSFDAWLETIPGDVVIDDDDPIYGWMDAAGIPADWQDLAWVAFCDRFGGAAKTYADWRAAFRNYVRNGWLDVWRVLPSGQYALTTKGEQWRRVRDSQLRGKAA